MVYALRAGTLFVLGFLVPLFLYAEGGSGACDSAYNRCVQQKQQGCEQKWQSCMSKCNVGGGAVGSCNKDPECQLHCTEAATSQGGRLSCCEGGPKHQNSCPNKVDGNCEPKKTEGGEGKMPELPKPPQGGGGGGEPQPPQGDCMQNASSGPFLNNATSTTTASSSGNTKPCTSAYAGVSSYLGDLFSSGNNNDETGGVQSTLSSAAERLSEFLFGVESESEEESANTAVTNGNTNTPTVPSGSTQLSPQIVQAYPIQPGVGADAPSAAVTGFGAQNSASHDESGVMNAINEILAGLGITLNNLLSTLGF